MINYSASHCQGFESGLQPDSFATDCDYFYATVSKQISLNGHDIRQGLETYLTKNCNTLEQPENFKGVMTFAIGNMTETRTR